MLYYQPWKLWHSQWVLRHIFAIIRWTTWVYCSTLALSALLFCS
uniref:Uncharacterized protein n=1 Tax=Rhizophora mucronata TaxID=61149 RepID=A0A2P2KMA8_RHIMU